MVTLGR